MFWNEPLKRGKFSRVLALALCVAGCSTTQQAPRASDTGESSASPSPVEALAPASTLAPAAWIVTTESAPFARSASPARAAGTRADVVVDAAKSLHAMEGFGGAFNEHGWDAMAVLSEPQRQEVLRALFDPASGLRFNYCRTPIGASDYALDRYTLDETPGDFAMARFSIERDKKLLIPFIQAALKLRPDLRLWASAWTPPTWMKTNGAFDGGAMKDDARVYAAYALYLAKYVESYRSHGIDVSMVVPQNEPAQLTRYPSCDWSPAQYVTFIKDHLAPTFKSRGLDTQIFVGTINRGDWDVLSVLKDSGTTAVISGVGLQWGGLAHVAPVRAAYPELTIMQSETECGNQASKPGYDPDKPPNDFTYAAYTFRTLRDFIGGGASSYMLWNMVLDEHGKNIDSERPWPQNSAIVVNRKTKQVTYTPMFWVTKHFSSLIEPGARLVQTSGAYADRVAFQNPDGTLVVELLNDGAEVVKLTIAAGAREHAVELPPQSVASLLIPKE
jgi:glucosylceramidase